MNILLGLCTYVYFFTGLQLVYLKNIYETQLVLVRHLGTLFHNWDKTGSLHYSTVLHMTPYSNSKILF